MNEIDKYDAPEGYVAVAPIGYDLGGRGSCDGCIFNEDLDICEIYDLRCSKIYRADKQDVIFIKKHEGDIND